MMLADVQLKLEAVRDNVKALRALCAETTEPTNPAVVPPLAAPRETAPTEGDAQSPTQGNVPDVLHIDVLNTPLDIDTDMEDDVEWQTVQPRMRTSKVLMKLKGTPSGKKRESLTHMSAKLKSSDGLDEFVEHCHSDVLNSLMKYAPETASISQESLSSSAVGSAAKESCGWRSQFPEWKPGQKRVFFSRF